MNPQKRFSSFSAAWPTVAVVLAVLSFAGVAYGANATWSTSGTTVNWNLAGNWGGTLPINGNTLVFGADSSVGTTALDFLNNDMTGLSVAGITFNAGAPAYIFYGNALTLTGGITNNVTNLQTINFNIVTTAAQTMTMTAGGGDIILNGNISGALGGITTAGTGVLTLTGSNSYTGATTVSAAGTTLNLTGTLNGSGVTVGNATATFNEGSTGVITGVSGSTSTL